MIHRVADRHLKSLRECDELFKGIRIAGHDIFRHTVGTHNAPLIMISEISAVSCFSAKPDFRDVVVTAVLIDFLRRDVAVVVDDRQIFRVGVEEVLCRLILQHEIFSHERLHSESSFI